MKRVGCSFFNALIVVAVRVERASPSQLIALPRHCQTVQRQKRCHTQAPPQTGSLGAVTVTISPIFRYVITLDDALRHSSEYKRYSYHPEPSPYPFTYLYLYFWF